MSHEVPLLAALDLKEFWLLETDLATVAHRVGVYHSLRTAVAAILELEAAGLNPDGNLYVDGHWGLVISLWYYPKERR
ncbi:MAG: hypothetical protein Q8R28_11355 [Dehalococcoidia bacterium]|nr:hypothetical protein [Dehalococcoidia bacterium]